MVWVSDTIPPIAGSRACNGSWRYLNLPCISVEFDLSNDQAVVSKVLRIYAGKDRSENFS